jgi:hypothetical protein
MANPRDRPRLPLHPAGDDIARITIIPNAVVRRCLGISLIHNLREQLTVLHILDLICSRHEPLVHALFYALTLHALMKLWTLHIF